MYKTVSFNIFKENLQDTVNGKYSFSQTKNNNIDRKTVEVIGEVTIPKITIPESVSSARRVIIGKYRRVKIGKLKKH